MDMASTSIGSLIDGSVSNVYGICCVMYGTEIFCVMASFHLYIGACLPLTWMSYPPRFYFLPAFNCQNIISLARIYFWYTLSAVSKYRSLIYTVPRIVFCFLIYWYVLTGNWQHIYDLNISNISIFGMIMCICINMFINFSNYFFFWNDHAWLYQ